MPTTTSAPPATVPAATAATGRIQLRGSRRASSSPSESSSAQLESSAAACSVIAVSVLSTRVARSSGGSMGRSASASNPSSLGCSCRSVIPSPIFRCASVLHLLLELFDRPMDQDLRGAIGAPQGAGDLAVRHPECEAHDQRLAAILAESLEPLHDEAQILAALDDLLGAMGVRRWLHRVERRLLAPGAISVVVRGEVVGDPDQPRAQGPAARFSLRALEVPVRLQKGLLG